MKIGTVRDRGRLVPTAQLEVMGEVGEPESVSALVDTGFTECFALPLHVIERLGLQPVGSELLAFGNLAQEMVNVYEAYVYWGTAWHSILVHQLPGNPTIGMELLRGYRLAVDALPQGPIEIEPIDLR